MMYFIIKKILISWKSQVENISEVSKEKPSGGAVIQSEECAPRRCSENTTQTKEAMRGGRQRRVKCSFSRATSQHKREEKTLGVSGRKYRLAWREHPLCKEAQAERHGSVWSLGTAVTPPQAQAGCPPEPEPEPSEPGLEEGRLEVRHPGEWVAHSWWKSPKNEEVKKSLGCGREPRRGGADGLESETL